MEIIRRKAEFTVLDGDMFYNIMPHETEEDYYDQVEQIGSLSKNLMQTGLPVLWTMAGNLDKLSKTYNSRFFREIYCLALVCEEELLRARMRDGRGITDEGWIQSSVDPGIWHGKWKPPFEQTAEQQKCPTFKEVSFCDTSLIPP